MAKLSNYRRDAFVQAVLLDVPSVDYKEQFHNLVRKDAHDTLPKEVKAVVDAGLTDFLYSQITYIINMHCMGGVRTFNRYYVPTEEARAKLQAIHDAHEAQDEARTSLRQKLRSAIYSCNTLKQARELLPELAHHLPVETTMTAQVPQVAGLVADLTKAGWKPKQ